MDDFKKILDPNYIKKSKNSICKTCIHQLYWNGEFYECAVIDADLVVKYKEDDIFHTEIIQCNKYGDKNE